MTSKDIIIKLIDDKVITGEEAYLLINDVLKAEMVAVNEALGTFKKNVDSINIPSVWTTSNPYSYHLANGSSTTTAVSSI